MKKELPSLEVGDFVYKGGGDYLFGGMVVAVFHKMSGKVRYVVENEDGILHIFNSKQLKLIVSKRGLEVDGPTPET